AAAGGVRTVLHRDVVVGDDRCDSDVGRLGQFGGHLEVHDVARVVLDEVEYAASGVDGLRCGQHLVGNGRGEHLAGACGVEHACADEARVQRFVPRAAARHDADLAGACGLGSVDDAVLVV